MTCCFRKLEISGLYQVWGYRDFETALVYTGTCLFEGTNLSEGRGTTCALKS